MICFFHADLDGRCGGAIVRRYFEKHPEVFEYDQAFYVEVDYPQDSALPEVIIREDEFVFIVDFHFSPTIIEKMFEDTKNIIWIDHHQTAAQYEDQYPEKLEGIRDYGEKLSGCELTWNHLFVHEAMPRVVQLIGDRDTWSWKLKDTAMCNEGLKLYPHQPKDEIWDSLLDMDSVLHRIIQEGKICLQYRNMILSDYRKSYGYKVEFEGHTCYVVNVKLVGSGPETFGSKIDKYDICATTVFSKGMWNITLYSRKIDVSKIATKYGGGGHKRAAGFVAPELPFGKTNWMINSAKRMFGLLTRAQDFLQSGKPDELLLDEIVVERNKWWNWQKNQIASKDRRGGKF